MLEQWNCHETYVILLMCFPKTSQNMACRLELTYKIVFGTEEGFADWVFCNRCIIQCYTHTSH